MAAQSAAVLEAVQETVTGCAPLQLAGLSQPGTLQTTQPGSVDFHQTFTMGETLGQASHALDNDQAVKASLL